jgi:hypothetical protein
VIQAEPPVEGIPSGEESNAAPLVSAPAASSGSYNAGNTAGSGGAMPAVTVGQLRNMLVSPLMLTLSILISVSAFFSLVSGRVNIFAILYAIAFWISYASARGVETEMKTGGLKMNYYVSKAFMIVMWVVIGLVAAGVVIFSLCAVFGASIPTYRIFGNGVDLIPSFSDSFYGLAYGIPFPFDAAIINSAMLSASVYFVLLAFILLIICVLMVVIQIFYIRSISKFSRSVYNAALNGRGALIKAKAVRQWTFVLGIFSCLSIFGVGYDLGQNLAALSGACSGAAMIVGSIMMKKFFADPVSNNNM